MFSNIIRKIYPEFGTKTRENAWLTSCIFPFKMSDSNMPDMHCPENSICHFICRLKGGLATLHCQCFFLHCIGENAQSAFNDAAEKFFKLVLLLLVH